MSAANNAAVRKYRRAHPELVRKWRLAWKERNPDYHREYRKRNTETMRANERRYRAAHLERIRKTKRDSERRRRGTDKYYEYQYRSRFGISLAQYNEMLEKQHGKCAICRQPPKTRLRVDHCHHTKKNRGLLCDRCNTCLERIEKFPYWGTWATEYLECQQ